MKQRPGPANFFEDSWRAKGVQARERRHRSRRAEDLAGRPVRFGLKNWDFSGTFAINSWMRFARRFGPGRRRAARRPAGLQVVDSVQDGARHLGRMTVANLGLCEFPLGGVRAGLSRRYIVGASDRARPAFEGPPTRKRRGRGCARTSINTNATRWCWIMCGWVMF